MKIGYIKDTADAFILHPVLLIAGKYGIRYHTGTRGFGVIIFRSVRSAIQITIGKHSLLFRREEHP